MDTATMLVAVRTLDLVLADLGRTERALARLAAEHRDTAMPGRTLTQHAVPTTFGLKAAGWRSLVWTHGIASPPYGTVFRPNSAARPGRWRPSPPTVPGTRRP